MTCEQWGMLPTVACNGYTLCDVVQMYPCQRYICDVCFEQLYRTKGTTVTCDGTPLQYPPSRMMSRGIIRLGAGSHRWMVM